MNSRLIQSTMMIAMGLVAFLATSLAFAGTTAPTPTTYNVGTGMYDITGPAAGLGMMGYAQMDQLTAGIHLRLRARAFVIEDRDTGNRIAFVSADVGELFQAVQQGVMARLQSTFGDVYTDANVMLSATHTHSGPGGYSHYPLYNVTTFGFNQQNYEAIVNGIYQSIVRATANLEPGRIEVSSGTLADGVTSLNRSLIAAQQNPDFDPAHTVDNRMVVLRFSKENGNALGVFSWFAVHATSMGQENQLISSDNKGYASYLFERAMGTNYFNPKTFVAAFAQSNEGDSSPNIRGGEDGYGSNDFLSTQYAGEKQYQLASSLFSSDNPDSLPLSGSVEYRHAYVDFSHVLVGPDYAGERSGYTSAAAIGYSFGAGAEDGPSGLPYFKEGMTADEYTPDTGLGAVQQLLSDVPILGDIVGYNFPYLWDEHYPKPVLLTTGMAQPYPWTPEVLPVQIFRIGPLAILGVPGEVTTVAGRRLKDTVEQTLSQDGTIEYMVLAGLANAYAGYITTQEEYDSQHYEGASNHFGPLTLDAYRQEFDRLAMAMVDDQAVDGGPTPRNVTGYQISLQPGVFWDSVPSGTQFGSVKRDANANYARGERVTVQFWSGHPANDLQTQSSFLEVQQSMDGAWKTIAYDWDSDTIYRWERKDLLLGTSLSTVEWETDSDTAPGTYRILHRGVHKSPSGILRPYHGYSRTFEIF